MSGVVARPDPFAELGELRGTLHRMFDEWLDGRESARIPAIDVVGEEGKLLVHADLPRNEPELVKIEVEDQLLTIAGEHEERQEKRAGHHVWRERRDRSFSHSMTLPAGVDASRIVATARDGVIEVTIPLPTGAHRERIAITPKTA